MKVPNPRSSAMPQSLPRFSKSSVKPRQRLINSTSVGQSSNDKGGLHLFDSVTNAANCLDDFRTGSQLFSQPEDMRVDSAAHDRDINPANEIDQLVAREYATAILRQRNQKPELRRRQRDQLAVAASLMCGGVDLEVLD